MPTVPTYKRKILPATVPAVRRQQYRIAQLETPPVKVAPQSGVAQFGQAVSSVANDLYTKELEKQNRIRVLAAKNQVEAGTNQLLYDPKTGALNVHGQAVHALPDQVGQQFKQIVSKAREGLSNDQQRQIFDEYAASANQETYRTVMQHVARENYSIDSAHVDAYKTNRIQAALGDPDPRAAELAASDIANEYNRYGKDWGKDSEETKLAIATAQSDLFSAKVRQYQDRNQDIQAKVYYQNHQDQILPSERGKIEESLKKTTTLGDAQRIVDTVMAGYTQDTPQSQLEANIPKYTSDPETRAKAEEMLDRKFAVMRADDNFRERQASAQAKQKLDEFEQTWKNNIANAPRNQTYEQKVPQSIRDQLPVAVDRSLREFDKMISEQKEPKTDPGTFYKLYLQASDDKTKDKFAQTNLMQYVNVLSRSDFDKLTELQGSIIKGDDKTANKNLDDFRTANEMINDSLATMGLDPKKKENEAAVARVHQMIGERADMEERLTGKKITHADLQQITDDVISKSYKYKEGWIWQTEKEKPLVSLTIDDVPKADRQQIEDTLRKNNRTVTDDAILDLYIRTQERIR